MIVKFVTIQANLCERFHTFDIKKLVRSDNYIMVITTNWSQLTTQRTTLTTKPWALTTKLSSLTTFFG